MTTRFDRALVWFRRDLRAEDHAALHAACRAARQVFCLFVFDTDILAPLPRQDRRVEFIRDSLADLDGQLRALGLSHGVEGVGLIVRHGPACQVVPALARQLRVQAVFANHDDEPDALARDSAVLGHLADEDISFYTSKDHVVCERAEVMTASGTPFSVFTPYKNAWLKKLDPFYLKPYPVARHAAALAPWPQAELGPPAGVPELQNIDFQRTDLHTLRLPSGTAGAKEMLADFLDRIDAYDQARDFPAVKGPSYLSTHLRFGTISIRRLVREAWQRMAGGSRGATVWLSELIWRDFYHQILHHHPHVVGHAFKREYDALHWAHGKTADAHFEAWCQGRTGYPLVDAAMRQLARTGYMHNRLRMVSASFLVKDLGIDWRRGEAWFALHLNDFDLAANSGGWQWAASTGCDAQPWFRIFNPVTQSEKFDPEGKFIRRYVPELAALPASALHAPWLAKPLELAEAGVRLGSDYPLPLVDHAQARQATLARYGMVRSQERTPPAVDD
ncbi:deoxyribodipyrimidine photo-lyase [Ideonella sp. B7]|uniref:cryptochrome/photolyase family protein n=1 Tax=Ideonella benzenivorans TaxID=2831643 RepID=UPI001CEDEA03|nr:deoxyribodipyrimidine photo-lyase [Ideonella benzenivorans]MCA6218895.1 deoxyribodipyrimidine photo-lyase [Ideonella benzenivorans]